MTTEEQLDDEHRHILELLSKLHDKEKTVRASVAKEVKKLDSNGKEILVSLLRSAQGEERCDAALALCLLDSDIYLPAVINLLNDPIDYVRWDIAGLLHDFGDKRAIEPLMKVILDDTDSEVRHNACYALSAIGDARALSALKYVMENDKGADYEGRLISEIAEEAINNILERTGGT